ncbi:G-protein coupled receptor 157-like [Dreissena polymorpha]|uniref:G-protein coupled receptors family 2 profile 2 domain-containing protein n=1 Tax=Dreissena polymorpha TaxID=45954 RepID=A0A9D4IVE4_DREPO|nr:G-protein coupled receptor 157-like [Dreissena polymorpha]KAH3788210.1 hypothetical protein DPMN_166344 [Dreissena polymorpha]
MKIDNFQVNSDKSATSEIATPEIFLTGTSSVLSIAGAIIIFATYRFVPKEYNFTRKLLVYLTIADFITAVGNLVGVSRYLHVYWTKTQNQNYTGLTNGTAINSTQENNLQDLCRVQSFFTTASNLASFLWTFVIAFHLWATVILKITLTSRRIAHLIYHVVCWGIPIAIVCTVIPHLGENYRYGTGIWCDLSNSNGNKPELELLMYRADIGWQLTSYVTSCFFYLHIIFYLFLHKRSLQDASNNQFRKEDRNFLFVWFVLYALKLWGVIRFFLTAYLNDDMLQRPKTTTCLEILLIFQSYGASGQAFWNCVLFCFCDKTVRRKMCRCWTVPVEAKATTTNENTPLLIEHEGQIERASATIETTLMTTKHDTKQRGSTNSQNGI